VEIHADEPLVNPERLHPHSSKVVQISDWRKDLDDTEASIALKYLATRGEVEVLGGIGTLTPPEQRARAGRYIFDQLGFTNIPVGVGSSSPKVRGEDIQPYEFGGIPKDVPIPTESAAEVLDKLLRGAEDSSLTILMLAQFKDLHDYLASAQEARDLFRKKVKDIIIMGGVKTTESGEIMLNEKGFMVPDTSANYDFNMEAAEFVIDFLQENSISTTFLSRYAARAAGLLTHTAVDAIAKTGHPLGLEIEDGYRRGMEDLWRRVKLDIKDPGRGLPERCDEQWFSDSFCFGEPINENEPIYPQVKQVLAYDELAAIAASPKRFKVLFDPLEIAINHTKHRVIGVSKEKNGLKNPDAAKRFLEECLVTGLQESLQS
jgi:hypothetical protein